MWAKNLNMCESAHKFGEKWVNFSTKKKLQIIKSVKNG